MEKHLFEKYDKRLPRYTSYPPYPFWKKDTDQELWYEHLAEVFEVNGKSANVYIHIPFCERLCLYCGCSRTITRKHDIEKPYVDSILKGWSHYKERFGEIALDGLYLGGGTPTFLGPENLEYLLGEFSGRLKMNDNIRATIEVDPRVTSPEHMQVIVDNGVKRISLGIQDFDPQVQEKIGRLQSVELVTKLVEDARKKGITEINFDLIYGLPGQDRDSIVRTISEVVKLAPETISFYSYAHTPSKIKNQKALEKYSMLQGWEKRELFELGRNLLVENDYVELGFDHFVKKGSSLHRARVDKTLTRNFMGYDVGSSDVTIGLGASSISHSVYSFIQNHKGYRDYMAGMEAGESVIANSHTLELVEVRISRVVQQLMCFECSDISTLLLLFPSEEAREMLDELDGYEKEGFITLRDGIVRVTEKGRPFLRNICAVFDFHMKNVTKEMFSRSV